MNLTPISLGLSAVLALSGQAPAEGMVLGSDTHLVDLRVGSAQTARVAQSAVDYELSDGTPANVARFYRSRTKDLSVLMLTELSPSTGLLWGVSLGDSGEKYRIDPSLRLGFVHNERIGDNGLLALKVVVRAGGRLREKPCVADYGDIGGVQAVNCRLAASQMRPADTLNYLFNHPAPDRVEASLTMTWTF